MLEFHPTICVIFVCSQKKIKITMNKICGACYAHISIILIGDILIGLTEEAILELYLTIC